MKLQFFSIDNYMVLKFLDLSVDIIDKIKELDLKCDRFSVSFYYTYKDRNYTLVSINDSNQFKEINKLLLDYINSNLIKHPLKTYYLTYQKDN